MPNGQLFLSFHKVEQLWYITKCHLQALPINFSTYRIVGNFWGRNFHELVKIWLRRKLSWTARFCSAKERHSQNFAEKTFVYRDKIVNFAKVFSLETFLLYSTWELHHSVHFLKKIRTWTHFSFWRLWFTRKASLSAHTPSSLIRFLLRLQNVREQEMRGGPTNFFTLCKVYLVSVPH